MSKKKTARKRAGPATPPSKKKPAPTEKRGSAAAKKKTRRRKRTGSGAEDYRIDNMKKLRAMAHPLRQQLIQEFAKGPATTKQVAERLNEKPTRLYHHVAKLETAGIINLVETRQVRGTTEKYYKLVSRKLQIDGTAKQSSSLVLDNMLDNVKLEVATYLEGIDENDHTEGDIVFAKADLRIPRDKINFYKKKIEELMMEINRHEDKAGATAGKAEDEASQRISLILGWYPRGK